MTFIHSLPPGHLGFTTLLTHTGSIPVSLARLEVMLTNNGYTTHIARGWPDTLLRDRDVHGTTMGWLLTWWQTSPRGLVECGNLWVVDGVDPRIRSTLV